MGSEGGCCSLGLALNQRLLRERFPELMAHLDERGFQITMVATGWFMCIFISFLPWEICLRILDYFFCGSTHAGETLTCLPKFCADPGSFSCGFGSVHAQRAKAHGERGTVLGDLCAPVLTVPSANGGHFGGSAAQRLRSGGDCVGRLLFGKRVTNSCLASAIFSYLFIDRLSSDRVEQMLAEVSGFLSSRPRPERRS